MKVDGVSVETVSTAMGVGYAHFAMDRPVSVEITASEPIVSYDLSPHRRGMGSPAGNPSVTSVPAGTTDWTGASSMPGGSTATGTARIGGVTATAGATGTEATGDATVIGAAATRARTTAETAGSIPAVAVGSNRASA